MKKTLKKTSNLRYILRYVLAAVIILALSFFGARYLVSSHADNPFASLFAASGKLTGNAAVKSSGIAPGGQYVQFQNPTQTPSSSLLWGVGDELSGAQTSSIYTSGAPVNMLTAWYNGPNDLSWMSGYSTQSNNQLSQIYGSGKAVEVVVWLASGTDGRNSASSSTAGETLPQYALSSQFLTDLKTVIGDYEGHGPNYGPMYVVLFSEFQNTYAYNWPGSPYTNSDEYYAALMQQYQKAVSQIHSQYSQAKVALGFGGYAWQNGTTDDNINLSDFTQAIAASDFTSVQEMQSCSNESLMHSQMLSSVKQLGSYGKPVMISHFKLWPPNGSTAPDSCSDTSMAAFEQDTLNSTTVAQLKSEGLFAWDFMNDDYINDPGASFNYAKSFISSNAEPASYFP